MNILYLYRSRRKAEVPNKLSPVNFVEHPGYNPSRRTLFSYPLTRIIYRLYVSTSGLYTNVFKYYSPTRSANK